MFTDKIEILLENSEDVFSKTRQKKIYLTRKAFEMDIFSKYLILYNKKLNNISFIPCQQ